eukprot:6182130-Pleurochrysis_carterae.AAC.1
MALATVCHSGLRLDYEAHSAEECTQKFWNVSPTREWFPKFPGAFMKLAFGHVLFSFRTFTCERVSFPDFAGAHQPILHG